MKTLLLFIRIILSYKKLQFITNVKMQETCSFMTNLVELLIIIVGGNYVGYDN